jgi:hypothetical protein
MTCPGNAKEERPGVEGRFEIYPMRFGPDAL